MVKYAKEVAEPKAAKVGGAGGAGRGPGHRTRPLDSQQALGRPGGALPGAWLQPRQPASPWGPANRPCTAWTAVSSAPGRCRRRLQPRGMWGGSSVLVAAGGPPPLPLAASGHAQPAVHRGGASRARLEAAAGRQRQAPAVAARRRLERGPMRTSPQPGQRCQLHQ